jgi:hypothetical protein
MMRLTLFLVFTCVSANTSTFAMARSDHRSLPATYLSNPCDNPHAILAQGPYVGYNPCKDPNSVFVGGTYAGSDPDPNIRAALAREFGRY